MVSFLSLLNIDYLIVISSLIAVLVIGIRSSFKIKSVREYAIGDKNSFSTSQIAITFIATLIGGAVTVGVVGGFFIDGYIFALPLAGHILGMLILAKFIAPKFDDRFAGMLSSADIIGKFYGKTPEKLTGVIITVYGVCSISTQITALAFVLSEFLGLPYQLSVIIFGGIMVMYSSFGGIHSVTTTDIIQFLLIAVGIPIIANLTLQEIGNFDSVFAMLTENQRTFIKHERFDIYLALFLAALLPSTWLYPTVIQRYLMAKDSKQIVKITYLYIFVISAIFFMMACIAFCAVKLFPDIEPNSIISNSISYVLPIGLKGIVVAGMVAVIMSSADSILNVTGIVITLNTFFSKDMGEVQKLNLMRINTAIVGAVSLIIASLAVEIVQLRMIAIYLMTFSSIPLFMKIIGLVVDRKQFWINICAGLFSLMIVKLIIGLDARLCFFISSLSSFIAFTIAHLIMNGGHFKYDAPKANNKNSFRSIRNLYHNYIPAFSKIIQYSISKVKEVGAPYQIFGIFCCVNYATPYFLWSFDKLPNQDYIIIIRFIASLLCVGLIISDQWHQKLNRYLPVYWHFTVMFCLPFMTAITFFITQAQHGWLLNMALAMFFLAIIVDWQTFILLNTVGILLGIGFYKLFLGNILINLDIKTIYLTIYIFIFSTLIGMLFSRNREIRYHDKLRIMKFFGSAMAHEIKTPVGQLNTLLSGMERCWQKSSFKESKDWVDVRFPKKLYNTFNEILLNYKSYVRESNEIIDNLLICVQDSIGGEDWQKFSINDLIVDIRDRMLLTKGIQDRIFFDPTDDIRVFAPKVLVRHVIINLIKNACKYALIKERSILEIKVTENRVYFHDTGYGISEEHIKKIFEQFYSTDREGTGLGLAFCKMVMEGINGNIECKSEKGKFTTFILTFSSNK